MVAEIYSGVDIMKESFYQDLIDNLYDGVYFVDRDRVITHWNKAPRNSPDTPVSTPWVSLATTTSWHT